MCSLAVPADRNINSTPYQINLGTLLSLDIPRADSSLCQQHKLTTNAHTPVYVLSTRALTRMLDSCPPGAMRTSAPDISVDTGNTDTSALLM